MMVMVCSESTAPGLELNSVHFVQHKFIKTNTVQSILYLLNQMLPLFSFCPQIIAAPPEGLDEINATLV